MKRPDEAIERLVGAVQKIEGHDWRDWRRYVEAGDINTILAYVREQDERLSRYSDALVEIGAYDDGRASDALKSTGSYSAFDEPGSVQIAREALDASP